MKRLLSPRWNAGAQWRRSAHGLSILPYLFLAMATSAPAGEPAFTIHVATVAPRGSSFHKHFQAMGEEWKTAPGGGVLLDIYPGTQGGEPTIVRRMNPRVAQLDGAMLTGIGIQMIDPDVTALQLMPMMFRSWDEVDFVRERLRPRLEKKLYEKGYVVLFWADGGWVRWFSKSPIVRPADLKPMKVYASSGDPKTVEIMKDYYNPIVLEPDKILTSLQTDMISAVPMPAFLANFLQVATQTGHMLDMNYCPIVGAMVVTRRAWDKLPAETQAALRKSAEAAGEEIRRSSRAEDLAAIKTMREKNHLQVHEPTAEDLEEWRAEIAKIYPKLRGEVVPADLFDEVEAALKEFRAKSPPAK
jgi:TRAP-type C4-dicarboxylate transport system substrate-binding protein